MFPTDETLVFYKFAASAYYLSNTAV